MPMAGQEMKRNKILDLCREFLCSLLFPRRCPVCDKILEPEEEKYGIHQKCKRKIYPVYGAVCMHCGRPLGEKNHKDSITEYEKYMHMESESAREYCYDCMKKRYNRNSNIVQAKSLYLYRGTMKKTMYRFKYSNKREYAKFFAKQAVQQYGKWIGVEDTQKHFDVIVPVPMYRPKQRLRGYNQAESFARELSKVTGIPVDINLVQRVSDTTPQKELNDMERKNNLKNAFSTGKSRGNYRCALVVDDIYTTGSTAEAVAFELQKFGIPQIYFLTICIGADV